MSCSSPPEIPNGFVSYDSLAGGPTWTADVNYECFKYHGLVGSSKLTCSGGQWTGTTPQCEWHRDAEITFWFLIALVIFMVLLLICLVIFVCWYFGRCCGCGKRNRLSFDDD